MADKTASLPLSLLKPNFTGLWNTNHLGKENDIWTTVLGAAALQVFICSWIFGFATPVIVVVLFYLRYTTIALLLSSTLLYPYIVRVQVWPTWQKFLLKACGYFEGGISVSFEHEIDCDQPVLFCVHPHGMFTFGAMYSGLRGRVLTDKLFSRLAGCALIDSKLVNAPIFKHVVIGWLGGADGFRSASKKSMIQLFKDRSLSFYLIPGGFNEAALLKKGFDVAYIKNRKGFIKYALQYGCNVLPGYTFGECCTYDALLSGQSKLKTWLTNRQVPCVFPYGPFFWCGSLLPYRKNVGLHTIYGNLKKFPRIEQPTKEDIDTYHKWYVDELCRIFDNNKWRFGITHELVVV